MPAAAVRLLSATAKTPMTLASGATGIVVLPAALIRFDAAREVRGTLGLFVSLETAIVFGFGISGFVIAAQSGLDDVTRYLGFIALTLMLLLTLLCLGAFASIISDGRTRSFGVALGVWFVFVLFYDLIAMGVACLVNPHTANTIILFSLFGNPLDLARVCGLLILGGPTIFGAAGAALVKIFGSAALTTVVLSLAAVCWSTLVLAATSRILIRREI